MVPLDAPTPAISTSPRPSPCLSSSRAPVNSMPRKVSSTGAIGSSTIANATTRASTVAGSANSRRLCLSLPMRVSISGRSGWTFAFISAAAFA